MDEQQIYLNDMQMDGAIVNAQSEIGECARGTGKTTGRLSVKSADTFVKTMPRSTGAIIGATYNQILTRTLPELVKGWQMLGYDMDHHFIVGKTPTDRWKSMWYWKPPYSPIFDFKYAVTWYNGATFRLVSQDRPGSGNGMSVDHHLGDEAKLLNEQKYRTEFLPANRGYVREFANNPHHHGYILTTDMPVGTAGRWILDMKKSMNVEKVDQIKQYQLLIAKLKTAKGWKENPKVLRAIQEVEDIINDCRRNLLHYYEYSTLTNIYALGVDYIYQQMRDTSVSQFETQILNLKPQRVEDGFYPDFDEEYHGYFANDNDVLDKMGFDMSLIKQLNCLRDTDVAMDQPLHIALDYNRRIHPLEVVQLFPGEIRHINALEALYPHKLKDVLQTFIEYYKPKLYKVVYYWYDHTAVGDQNETRICDDVINTLRAAGWAVIPMYFGHAVSHEAKYRMWGNLLLEKGKYDKKFRTNRERCDHCITSMNRAPAIQNKDGFGKDKSSERKENVPANEATHHSDALDMVVWGLLHSGMDYSSVSGGGGGVLGI
jgi:hypothetical protein